MNMKKEMSLEALRKKREVINHEYLSRYLQENQAEARCPHCGRLHCYPHGQTKAGTPRFYCPTCNKAFVYNVHSVFYKTHKNYDQWQRFLECYLRAESLDVCAREAQIHRNTAFRWRHKVNDALKTLMNQDQLEGTVELDETFVERIEKGNEELKGSKKNEELAIKR
jgi:transposase-like protein